MPASSTVFFHLGRSFRSSLVVGESSVSVNPPPKLEGGQVAGLRDYDGVSTERRVPRKASLQKRGHLLALHCTEHVRGRAGQVVPAIEPDIADRDGERVSKQKLERSHRCGRCPRA